MDPTRFDTIAKEFARRRSRRAAVGGSLGLAATAIAGRVAAQDATPAATGEDTTHPNATTKNVTELFTQAFEAGTWEQAGSDDAYTLTLTGTPAHTIYFSDRPERIVGLWPTQEFLDTLGFTPENPPNAAVVARREGSDEQDILVIELLAPVYDPDAGTLTYDATVLADYGEPGLAHLATQQQDYEFDETFGEGSLFIDGLIDCPDGVGYCYSILNNEEVKVGDYSVGECYDASEGFTCEPCKRDYKSYYYGARCADAFPDQCHVTTDSKSYSWDCFVKVTEK